jgi:DNA replication protein DnaC
MQCTVTPQIENVRRLSHELRLFGIHESLERRSAEALSEQLPPIEYLRLVLEDERLNRKERAAKALKTRARFRSEAELEDWDHSIERGLSKPQFKDLTALGFFYNKENLIIAGPTGTGKTHLSIALGKKLCAENIRVRFYSVNLFLEECQAEKTAGRYLSFIRRLKPVDVIIMDDFGLRNYSHEEATLLVDLLEERYQLGSLIVTSQVAPTGWKKLFEDPVIAEAIVDRIVNPSKQIALAGLSYRTKLKKSVASKKLES